MLESTVLLVDDDEDSVLVMEAALVGGGFAVQIARSCREARALLDAHRVDALVTDFSLGDGTALELFASLAAAKRPRVAVLVTGYGSPEDLARSRAAGFHAHLVKPVSLEQLERTLRTALATSAEASLR
jgi:DNA-binding NtrC family response regulator